MKPPRKKMADSCCYDFPDLFRQDAVLRIEQLYKEIERPQQRIEELRQKVKPEGLLEIWKKGIEGKQKNV